jgi:hypothetical protein
MIEWLRSRLTTTWHLARACMRVVRLHPRLLVFPLLSGLTSLLVLVSAVLWPPLAPDVMLWVFARSERAAFLLPLVAFGLTFLGLYLLYVVACFFNVALAHAVLRALREDEPRVGSALRYAASRLRSIFAYAALAAAVGLFLGCLQERMRWVSRFLPIALGTGWSTLALLAIPVLVQERRGAVASVRRAAVLVRERWGEGAAAVVSLWVLWLPLAAIQGALFASGGMPDVPPRMLFALLGAAAVLNALPLLARSFLNTLYGSALYVTALEGVVPGPLDLGELSTVWRVSPGTTAASSLTPVPAGSRRRSLSAWWLAPVAIVAIAAGLVWVGLAVRDTSRLLRRELLPSGGPGLPVDRGTFPPALVLAWERSLPEPIVALAGAGNDVVAMSFEHVFVLDAEGAVRGWFPLDRIGGERLALLRVPGTTGRAVVVDGSDRRGESFTSVLTAYDRSGRVLWKYEAAEVALADMAVLSTRTEDLLLVSYHGRLCAIDGGGKERWCLDRLVMGWSVDALDCTGDGVEEALWASQESHPYFGVKLGCYSAGSGEKVRDIDLPAEPYQVRSADFDGDGREELVTWSRDGLLRGPQVLSVRAPGGPVQLDLRLAGAAHDEILAEVGTARLRPGGADAFVSLPNGWVVGSSQRGPRWGLYLPESDRTPYGARPVGVVDRDGDGRDALLTANGHTLTAWEWAASEGSPAR